MGENRSLDDYKRLFSVNLSRLMSERHKTISEISADLAFPYMTVSDWVKGKKIPRMDKIERLAGYFGVSKASLIEETKKKETPDETGASSEWISLFNALSDDGKSLVLERARTLLDIQNKQET